MMLMDGAHSNPTLNSQLDVLGTGGTSSVRQLNQFLGGEFYTTTSAHGGNQTALRTAMGDYVWDQAAIERMLDFGTPENPTKLDVHTLDSVIFFLYDEDVPADQKKAANEVLNEFLQHELAWTRCHQILDEASHQYTKRFALQVLDGTIQRAWRVLPAEQAEGIKEFVVQSAIDLASSFETLDNERTFVLKLNSVLIQIVVQEWPDKWPTFISDIVGASKSSESLCENNMRILKELSDEVFENPGRMTEAKATRLKESMKEEFGAVFELCQYVLTESECPSLLLETLSTLLGFINWIDLEYVFGSDLVELLVRKFFLVPNFRNATLKVLNELAGITHEGAVEKQLIIFDEVMRQLIEIVPPSVDLQVAFADGTQDEKDFVQQLGIFLATFLKSHSAVLEEQDVELLGVALEYMVNVSRVEDTELFKVCMEYWNALAESLFNEPQRGDRGLLVGARGMHTISARGSFDTPRHELYRPRLVDLRVIMVESMTKPEEVLVVEREGEVIREPVKDTDSMEQYKFMRQTLVYLTHLDVENTEHIMTEKLSRQVDQSEYSWKNLNTLCWAIGSISGAMNEDHEKRFLVTVIKDLLGLCEHKKGKDHKAIIASNIMYIVGQYPRFLRAHWKFLRTVVNKLFEFMHERHEGVQDMACDTFIKIAKKCRKHFVITQLSEYAPFIDDILTNMAKIIMQLEPHQVHTFYEAIGHMIYAQTDTAIKAELIERLMQSPNEGWTEVISAAQSDVTVLQSIAVVERLDNILKINIHACESIGHDFQLQLQNIYMDMLLVYQKMSENIAEGITHEGEMVANQPLFKGMKIVKRDILRLVGSWISKSDDIELVRESYLPPLLEAVLGDYETNIPEARDAEVLSTMHKIVSKLRGDITDRVLPIFSAVFESTLSMITEEFDSFPEHRVGFYELLLAITEHCFEAFTELSEDQFKTVMDAVVWGFRHTMRNVAETSLQVLETIFNQVLSVVDTAPEFAQSFYSAFYLSTMEDIFSVANDSLHYGELQLHGQILQHQFSLIERNVIQVALSDKGDMGNDEYVGIFVSTKIKEAFPHLQDDHIGIITQGFFSYTEDIEQFVQHLRDFLVDTKEESGEDMASMYLEERRRKQEEAEQAKLKQIMHIGGMVAGAHDTEADFL